MPSFFYRKLSRALLFLLTSTLLAACAMVSPQRPEVNLAGLQIREATLSHLNMVADLTVFNPNNVALTVRGVDYTLQLEGINVADGRSLEPVEIGAGESAKVQLRIVTAYWDLLNLASQLQKTDDLTFTLSGKVRVGGYKILNKTFPFSKEGHIDPQTLRLRR
ncbi:MAG TPA: LEA type 2 family protein [Desulfuromonadales bacterium]|nr:LEA type 2 family protein [Desulfuromonadales bacterium]